MNLDLEVLRVECLVLNRGSLIVKVIALLSQQALLSL